MSFSLSRRFDTLMGVKRILFSISIGILLLGSVLFLPLSPVFAQSIGTCSCVPDINEPIKCTVNKDNCASGFSPKCTICTSVSNCTCVAKPSIQTNCVTDLLCKNANQVCCDGLVPVLNNTLCKGRYQCVPAKTPYLTKLCDSVQNDEVKKKECVDCMNSKKIWTAIGCVPTTTEGFVNTLLPFFIGISGGIAFLLILFGALQIMMSSGNPEKLNAGKELISAAITGLLLIIFSIFILQLIGVRILKIPGFS